MPEGHYVQEKIKLFPNGCWLALYNDICAGYIFSHPWQYNSPIELNSTIGKISGKIDCFYIHDIAIEPQYQKKGIGKLLFFKAKEIANHLKLGRITAVSVQNTALFWEKMGFQQSDIVKNKLLSYGNNCKYMILDL